jgi:ABC-type uncharacterized transport system involved in gliding motility auxiliary subunit
MLNRLVGLVGWLGTVLVFGALAIRFLRPEWQQYATWAAWAGLVCVLLYTLGQWREIARAFQRRQAKYGTVAALSVLVVLAILVAINYLSSRQNKRWDLTASQTYSLSDQTRQVLGQLDAPVKIYVFAREPEFERFRDRLREYEYQSRQVSVEYIDADRRPALVKQYGVQAYGTVVFDYKGRTERVTSDTEQDLTNGLIKVTTGQQKKIYFVQGHGERDSAGADRTGYSNVSTALGGDNFTVEKLVLAQQGKIPDDASVVVIASPNLDYFPGEIEAIKTYLGRGGKLLALVDPPEKSGARLPNLFALLHDWGFELGNDIVVDASGLGRLIGTDASVPLAANYPVHAITDRFNVLTAYPLSRSVSPVSGGVNGRTPQAFIETSPNSWAETDMAKLLTDGQVELEEKRGDRKGPISIAAAVSAAATAAPDAKPAADAAAQTAKAETRVVVVGDADFASNAGLGIGGNSDMFLNMVNWLAQQENLISIRARPDDDRRITLNADQQRRINWFTLLFLPGLILGAGVYTWWSRR